MSKKFLFLLILLFSLLIIIPSSFAEDVNADILYENINQLEENNIQDISINDESNVKNLDNGEEISIFEENSIGGSSENVITNDENSILETSDKNKLTSNDYKVTVNNITGYEGQHVFLSIEIASNGQSLNSKYVEYYYPTENGLKKSNFTTDSLNLIFNLPHFQSSATTELQYDDIPIIVYDSNGNILCESSYNVLILKPSPSDYTITEITPTEVFITGDTPRYSYPNSNENIIVCVSYYMGNRYQGTVTLNLDGKSYTADIFDGHAYINLKAPSKLGSYKVTVTYSGYIDVNDKEGQQIKPSSYTFTLIVKKYPTTVSAPKVTAKYKKSKYFTVKIKNKVTKKVLKNTQIILKVYTGKKYKTYKVKTNSKGVAKLNTKRFSVGTHKVVISSGNKNYYIKKTSKITIKKSKTTKKRKKVKYYVYKTKTKYLTAKFGHNVQVSEEEKYTKKGWKLVKYWWGKKTYYDPMLGYWNMVYGKFKKTYKVKVAKYKYV